MKYDPMNIKLQKLWVNSLLQNIKQKVWLRWNDAWTQYYATDIVLQPNEIWKLSAVEIKHSWITEMNHAHGNSL